MGVRDEGRNPYDLNYIEEEIELIETYLEEPASPPKKQQLRKPSRYSRGYARYWRDQPARKKGVRHARRCENLKQLMELTENEEYGDLEIQVDLMEPTVSAFAGLFMEQDKMKIWNDFINHSEEEQQRYLQGMEYSDNEEDSHDTDKEETTQDDDTWEDLDDKRSVHPAFSSDECFQRIDSNLRTYLNRKRVPWGKMEFLEDEVTSFFREWPTSVFVSHLDSSFERLLMHALCQYLDLQSYSFNDALGSRQTQVENKNDFFNPPHQSLSQYLRGKRLS